MPNAFRHLPRLLAPGLAALAAAGCASTAPATRTADFQYARDVAPQAVTETARGKGEVTVVWRFGSPEWVNTMCRNPRQNAPVYGCAMLDESGERCLMFLVEPKGYQDVDRLAVMGHELWHCQGARHG